MANFPNSNLSLEKAIKLFETGYSIEQVETQLKEEISSEAVLEYITGIAYEKAHNITYSQTARYNEAHAKNRVALFEKSVEKNPNFAEGHYALGIALNHLAIGRKRNVSSIDMIAQEDNERNAQEIKETCNQAQYHFAIAGKLEEGYRPKAEMYIQTIQTLSNSLTIK